MDGNEDVYRLNLCLSQRPNKTRFENLSAAEVRVSADVLLQDAAPASSAIQTDYNERADTRPKGLLSALSNNPG